MTTGWKNLPICAGRTWCEIYSILSKNTPFARLISLNRVNRQISYILIPSIVSFTRASSPQYRNSTPSRNLFEGIRTEHFVVGDPRTEGHNRHRGKSVPDQETAFYSYDMSIMAFLQTYVISHQASRFRKRIFDVDTNNILGGVTIDSYR